MSLFEVVIVFFICNWMVNSKTEIHEEPEFDYESNKKFYPNYDF
jgi:hypothetical protein